MTDDEYKKWLKLTDEQWGYLKVCNGFERRREDTPLIAAIVRFCKYAKTQNPYYKFFDILNDIELRDYVLYRDLMKLETTFKKPIFAYILNGKAENYIGSWPRNMEYLRKCIGKHNKTFNYDMFCKFIISLE